MIVVYILLALVLFVALLMLLPLQLYVRYDGRFTLKVGAAGIRFRLIPSLRELLEDDTLSPEKKRRIRKKLAKKEARAAKKDAKQIKKEEKQKKKGKKPQKKKNKKKSQTTPSPKKKKSLIRDIRFLARAAGILLKKFGRRLSVKLTRLEITIATDDAAKTALMFGGVSQAVAYLLKALDAYARLTYRNDRVRVEADFLSDTLSAELEILFSIRVGSLFTLAFSAIWLMVKEGFQKAGTKAKKQQRRKESVL